MVLCLKGGYTQLGGKFQKTKCPLLYMWLKHIIYDIFIFVVHSLKQKHIKKTSFDPCFQEFGHLHHSTVPIAEEYTLFCKMSVQSTNVGTKVIWNGKMSIVEIPSNASNVKRTFCKPH